MPGTPFPEPGQPAAYGPDSAELVAMRTRLEELRAQFPPETPADVRLRVARLLDKLTREIES